MKVLGLGCICYAAFVLQCTLAPEITIGRSAPQFLMLALATTAFFGRGGWAVLCAALLGLLSDALAPSGLGTDVVCFTLAAFVVQHVPWRRAIKAPILLGVMNFGMIFSLCVVSTAAREARGGPALSWPERIDLASGAAGYTALLGMGCAILCRIVWNLAVPRHERSRGALGKC